jgi:preprotein translocase subunit SecD
MMVRTTSFNIYLAVVVVAAALTGCQSPTRKAEKKPAFLKVHMEAPARVSAQTATVFRQAPMTVNVEPRPFLTEELVKTASVIDTLGGFAVRIEFNRSGRHLLEQYTAGNNTRRLLIFGRWTDPEDPKKEVDRWIGAPRVSQAITNGMLLFTPDASREEAERIALGLRNAAKKLGNDKESF